VQTDQRASCALVSSRAANSLVGRGRAPGSPPHIRGAELSSPFAPDRGRMSLEGLWDLRSEKDIEHLRRVAPRATGGRCRAAPSEGTAEASCEELEALKGNPERAAANARGLIETHGTEASEADRRIYAGQLRKRAAFQGIAQETREIRTATEQPAPFRIEEARVRSSTRPIAWCPRLRPARSTPMKGSSSRRRR